MKIPVRFWTRRCRGCSDTSAHDSHLTRLPWGSSVVPKTSWEFVLVRIRDDYNTVVTVPKSEYPKHSDAVMRVFEEFDPEKWRIGVDSNQDGSEDA